MRRRGSALLLCIVIISVCGTMLSFLYPRVRVLAWEVENGRCFALLQEEALSALYRVSQYLAVNTPAGPSGVFGEMEVGQCRDADVFEKAVPAGLTLAHRNEDVRLRVSVQWCRCRSRSKDPFCSSLRRMYRFPPLITDEGLIRYGLYPFDGSHPVTAEELKKTGIWRIRVESRLRGDSMKKRRVVYERIMECRKGGDARIWFTVRM